MRHAIYVLLLLAGPVFSAEPVYTWRSRADDPDRVYLYRAGKQIGGWCYRAKHYRPFDGETWGPPSDAPPVPLPELTFRGHAYMILGVAFSPDGKRIASGSFEMVKVWDLATRKEILSLQGNTGYARVAFSPDGKRIASGGLDQTVKVWDVAPPQSEQTRP